MFSRSGCCCCCCWHKAWRGEFIWITLWVGACWPRFAPMTSLRGTNSLLMKFNSLVRVSTRLSSLEFSCFNSSTLIWVSRVLCLLLKRLFLTAALFLSRLCRYSSLRFGSITLLTRANSELSSSSEQLVDRESILFQIYCCPQAHDELQDYLRSD